MVASIFTAYMTNYIITKYGLAHVVPSVLCHPDTNYDFLFSHTRTHAAPDSAHDRGKQQSMSISTEFLS